MDLARFEPIDALTELGQRRLRATKRPRRVAARRLRHREHVRTVNLLRGCTCASHCLEACLPLALPELDHAKESEKRAFDGVTRALDHREGLVHFLIGIPEITAVAVNQGSRSEGIRKADSDAAAADAHGARLVILDAFVEVPERVVVLAGRRVALSEVGHELYAKPLDAGPLGDPERLSAMRDGAFLIPEGVLDPAPPILGASNGFERVELAGVFDGASQDLELTSRGTVNAR